MHDSKDGNQADELVLTAEQKLELLKLARDAIATYLRLGAIPAYETSDPVFLRKYGVFVTLRESVVGGDSAASRFFSPPPGRLRGCVGRMQADLPLYLAVQEMAVKSATADPRFMPVLISELSRIQIEISILSPLVKVSNIDKIKIGVHGLLIEGMGMRGVLLPKVPVSRGWDREEFLDNLYLKAGLPPGSWPGHTTLYRFTALEFGEE